MSGTVPRVSSHRRTRLVADWKLCSTPVGTVGTPLQLRDVAADAWIEIAEAGTVAAALRAAGRWSIDAPARRFDADDWWFRARFDAAQAPSDVHRSLVFGGLAGLAEVWLNGEPLLVSHNMHLSHDCAEPALRGAGNELLLRFASLDDWLEQRRARPRWRAPMVEHQQLRWARVSLLGRTPGWSPPAAAVGPWREIELVERSRVEVSSLRLNSRVDGQRGMITLRCELTPIGATRIDSARLELEREGVTHHVALVATETDATLHDATLIVPDAVLWWPHTHGEPALYAARIVVDMGRGVDPVVIDLGRLGFRTLTLDTLGGNFALRVNGVAVFCRGACWTPLDVVSLRASAPEARAALEQVRDAGMNMLRLSGTMIYEDEPFFDACDALGILVWQDFMFANMDYPADDAAFNASVREEAAQQLARWQARPSLAVLCGNSEAEQQAAMWGSPRDSWSQPLFERELAELAAAWCPDVPYWPSSAHGGAFPHQNNAGTTSYYGVGAYLRPLDDARRADPRFATECLAFANVPADSTLARMPGGAGLRLYHAGWKARSPRDLGAGWDFDDVRDHYLEHLYGIDPVALRSSDHERYLAMSRALGAELMHATFAEWRRGASRCRGALVWFLRDLWPGAGWGLLDDRGVPKAAFHGLRRALAPLALFLSDEGTNGLDVHVVNEPGREFAATIEVALYRDDGLLMQQSSRAHTVPARGALALPVAAWFDGFLDLTRAYRFGPAEHAVVVATLRDGTGEALAQAFHFPQSLPSQRERDIGLVAHVRARDDGSAEITLTTRALAQSVYFDAPGFIAQDEYFHLAPGGTRSVTLIPAQPGAKPTLRGSAFALNAWTGAPLRVPA